MAVTEIALLSVKHPSAPTDTNQESLKIPHEVQEHLNLAASEQATFSGYPVTVLQCQDNRNQLFLIGGWESVSCHMEDWIPGPVNQGLMKSLGEHVDVKWMFHLDVEPAQVTKLLRAGEETEGNDAQAETATAAIGLYLVRDEHKDDCQVRMQTLSEKRPLVKEHTGRITYGWRLDKGFFGESEQGMRDVNNTVVMFTAADSSGDEMRQAEISQMLEGAVSEKHIHVVKVIDSREPTGETEKVW